MEFNQDMQIALEAFQTCISKEDDDNKELFRGQFAKAYYNIGLIHDKQGDVQQASYNYKNAMRTCEQDPKGWLINSGTYKKAGTNYAVTLEKLNYRDDAVATLSSLKANFNNEVRVFNNLGIIYKRKGETQKALENL